VKLIEIIVSPQGQATVLTRGFAEASCREATRSLERALGIIQSDVATTELYQGTNEPLREAQKS
jgi:hypothetical protein